MSMRITDLALPIIFVSTLLAVNVVAFSKESEVKAVRDAANLFYKALNSMFANNLEPMKKIWSHAEDVTYMGPMGGLQVGWDQVLANWEAQAALNLGGKVEAVDMRIIVGKDLAIVHNYEKGENKDQSGNSLPVQIRATNIFRKEKGVWKMIGHHTDLLPFLNNEQVDLRSRGQ